jgi:amino acid adenylation domain-containing protein
MTEFPPNYAPEQIDRFYEETLLLNGREIVERPHWNTLASADAIRHFAFGTSDDNPLWLDEAYAAASPHGRLLAPPAFVCSVLYPFLHGAAVEAPLTSLIGEISVDWLRTIRVGDRLRAAARQTEVTEALDRRGRRIFFIVAETTYWNQEDRVVATAKGTMVRIARGENDALLDRQMSRYDEAERDRLRRAIESESRAGQASPTGAEVWVGMPLPVVMRGPLTIGDLVCWQAAIGPSYRAGSLGYLDAVEAPHTAAVNPVTGWPVKYSQQHEDFLLAAQRGMPAPFDNSLMRFAWLAPLLTDWMGDHGFLKRLSVQTGAPLIYGDATWYRGVVVEKRPVTGADAVDVRIRIAGVNQLGATTTSGEAVVTLPARRVGARPPRPVGRKAARRRTGETLLDRFVAAARTQGDKAAIIGRREPISFTVLDARSDRVAARLVAMGCGPGTVVALSFPRVPDVVVAMLGVLKAGAAYLALEKEGAAERMRAVVETVRPALLIQAGNGSPGPVAAAVHDQGGRVAAWAELDAKEGPEHRWQAKNPGDEDVAYVMATSGTIATPRCVAVSHGAVARYLSGLRPVAGYRPDDVCLQSAAFHFSASVRQLFAGLSEGATLVLLDEEQRRDPREVLRAIKKHGVTVWDTVPSVWQASIDTLLLMPPAERADLLDSGLRIVLTTGERLCWRIPNAWRNRLGQTSRMVNLFSQTETAGTTCAFEIAEIEGADDEVVPLGYPLADTAVCVLDEAGKPVARGEIGEICVSGPRLAMGYVGQPELTWERFPLVPFRHEGFHTTGDLGRLDERGRLLFVGRSDLRVKIRGQRVEIEEVERALETCPGIDAAAVVCRDGGPRAASLVAYVVPDERDAPPAIPSILAHLRGIVAEAAVPSAILFLDELPRNAAGKVDRAALPSPRVESRDSVDDGDDRVAQVVRRLFLEALEGGPLDDEENFFDVGGNSLMATRVVARLRQRFGVDLPMRRFFDAPNVAAVSRVVEDLLFREIEGLSEEEAERLLDE